MFSTGGTTYYLNLPGVNKVVINPGFSVVLAMVQNSNTLYRIVKLPATANPVRPPGYVDCEPLLLPAYCVVPVAGTYDRPVNVNFSIDGNTAYVLNSGPENGGTTASVALLDTSKLNIDSVPTVDPLTIPPTDPSYPMSTLTGPSGARRQPRCDSWRRDSLGLRWNLPLSRGPATADERHPIRASSPAT